MCYNPRLVHDKLLGAPIFVLLALAELVVLVITMLMNVPYMSCVLGRMSPEAGRLGWGFVQEI